MTGSSCSLGLGGLALLFDILQYFFGAAFCGACGRIKEKEFQRLSTPLDHDFVAPQWINWPAIGFFWAKIVVLGVGYALLAIDLAGRLG